MLSLLLYGGLGSKVIPLPEVYNLFYVRVFFPTRSEFFTLPSPLLAGAFERTEKYEKDVQEQGPSVKGGRR